MTITIHLHAADGTATTLEAPEGRSLMQAATGANVNGIEADCGGMLTCATCHVYVRAPFFDRLPLPTEEEDGMLDFAAAERRPNSRLSCQIRLDASLDGLVVDLPSHQH